MPWCQGWGTTSMENWRGTFSIPRTVTLNEKNEMCLYSVKEFTALESEIKEYRDYEAVPERRYLNPADARSFSMELQIDVERVVSRYLEIGVLGAGDRAAVIDADLAEKVISLDKSQGDAIRKRQNELPGRAGEGESKAADPCGLQQRGSLHQ